MTLSREIAKDLLAIKAVQIQPDNYFTWTSGLKSPIYCDNRLTMSHPEIRNKIAEAFVQLIKQMDELPDVIAGCATAGIPHAAWVADKLNLPMVYVRSKPKGHGKQNQIEGRILPGQKVVVIEDLISTGGSSIEAAEALQNEGAIVQQILAIFTYGLDKAVLKFNQANFKHQTITNYDALLQLLVEDGILNAAQQDELTEWRNTI